MNSVNIKSIKDYQVCARLYDYRYGDDIYEPMSTEKLFEMRYENVLKNILTFLFHKKQSGNTPTFDFTVKKWQKLWFPKDVSISDILTIQTSTVSEYTIPGAANVAVRGLRNVYDHFDGDPSIPMLIDEEFTVPLTKNVRLTDKFDLVLKYPDHYKVIKWGASIRKQSISNLLLDFAALKYAFEYKNSDKAPLNVKYCLIDLSTPELKIHEYSIEQDDIDVVKYWSNAIVNDKHFLPRRGLTTYCRYCPFDKPCSKFKTPEFSND